MIYFHLATVLPAFFIGTFLMINRKGTRSHKMLGKIYMALMLATSTSTLFISADVGPSFLGHFGFIHLLTILVFYSVPSALIAARNGNIGRHRASMIGLYVGGLLVAGAFTFMPGRLLHSWFIG